MKILHNYCKMNSDSIFFFIYLFIYFFLGGGGGGGGVRELHKCKILQK